MPISNKTKEKVLAENFLECTSFWQQTRGMMFRKKVIPLIFSFQKQQNISLHSFFCPGNMDLVFLNEDWKVVELKREWPPRSRYKSERSALFLLELPAGSIWRSDTKVGDLIHILK